MTSSVLIIQNYDLFVKVGMVSQYASMVKWANE